MYSIGKLCREFSLSRSTLLYYDTIGLLTASERTQVNYRQYSEEDKKRLGQICAFREAGVPLNQIKDILDADEGMNESTILERRLNKLNQEIRYLRLQQKLIVEMLKGKNLTDKKMLMDSQTFISILKSTGLDDETLNYLHIQFEKNSPDSHQFFLEFLGLADEEIKHIRECCLQAEKRS
ncbi:HTH-type transcriptional activator TipA [Sporomusa ovata DSM 2662]|uniref:Transcriptional regulator, MerR family n=1 Tax=Sporomusa ovata TaxID=2378 RepID=A0A0U1L618_9FIRM|nr:MerR family transcriptional regulator [Sporomusa ovata]EQB24774.1 putative transcriptional regulator [Sporomusa ovata DSM 2662]CQR75120.1 transcriptional regulator, MerR family [Sporomusa ovata]